MTEQTKSLLVLGAGAVIAVGLYLVSQAVSDTNATHVQNTIKLATAVLGFGVSVYGGVKAFVELTKPTIELMAVQAASLTGIVGAILLAASQI